MITSGNFINHNVAVINSENARLSQPPVRGPGRSHDRQGAEGSHRTHGWNPTRKPATHLLRTSPTGIIAIPIDLVF